MIKMHVCKAQGIAKGCLVLGLAFSVHTSSPCVLGFCSLAQNQRHSTLIIGALLPLRDQFQIPVERIF